MGILFAYILKSALLVIAYYLLYRLLLSRDTFHRFNRWSLLGILIASIVLPLVQFSNSDTSAEVVGDVSIGVPTAMALVAEDVETTSWRPIILAWAVLLYWIGVVLFALRSALCYLSLIRILHQGERHRLSEYGITASTGNFPYDIDEANLWIEFLEENGISHVMWNFSKVSESSAAIKGSVLKTSGFEYDDFSTSGQWLIDMIESRSGNEQK